MSALKTLGKALFSRTMLGILLLIGLGLGLWFGGPYLGFGETRPLEEAGVRVMLMVLILSFVLFWLLHWPVSVVGGAALCLLIWYGSPLLAVGDAHPFAPEGIRILLVGGIILLFCLYLGRKLWVALQADNALMRRILNPTAESPAKEQIKELQHIVLRSLGHLRTVTAEVSGLRRVFQHSRYIYELPWYMVFGAPGTGKTTLVLNSGLQFPLAEQAGAVSLSGIQGTRNCVWWFTDEAVLIDTAGRYTTHETNAEVDAAEWKGFLGLLRKYRPRAPLNGAIVAVSSEELAGASPSDLNRLAANLRERLTELQDELGVSFPVYFLITKMDLVKGFRAYFQNLNSESRRQVFGFTLPQDPKGGRRPLASVRQTCEGELMLLQNRLEQGLNSRLHEEFAPERRRDLYCLPGDFHELAAPLMRLIESVFFESRYNATNIRHSLRGVYFTSAVQEDATLPLNRASLLQRLGNFVRGGITDPLAPLRTQVDSRSYFLENTLRKVIFPEAFLVRRNTRWELRFMLVRGLGHIVVLLAALGLGGALLGSGENNARLLTDIAARVAVFTENLRGIGGSTPETAAAIPSQSARDAGLAYVLEQACTLTAFPEVDTASPPFSYRVGLYSGAAPNEAAARLCVTLRERFLLPRFASVLESNLTRTTEQAARGREPERFLRLYEALEMYDNFHDPKQFNVDTLMGWLSVHMTETPETAVSPDIALFRDSAPLTGALREALHEAQRRDAAHDIGFERPTPLRQDLLEAARKQLQNLAREERLYLLVRQALEPEAPEPFVPLRHAGDDGALYRTDGNLADPVPGLFTYAGYHEVFQPRLADILPSALDTDKRLMGDRGNAGFTATQTEQARLNRDIAKLYYRDYVRRWATLVESIHAGSGTSPEQNLILLNRLGSGDSPLDRLAKAVVRETALSARDVSVTDQLTAVAEKRLRAKTRTTSLQFGSVDEAAMVDSRFASLRKVVTGSADPSSARAAETKSSAEMEEIRLLLTEFALFSRDLQKAAANRTLPPVSDITDRLRTKAQQSPPFFSNVLMDLATRGSQQEDVSKGDTLVTLLDQVVDPCNRMVDTRYPFAPDGRDADPVEFARVFGPGGSIETYFTKNLAPLVDTAASPWTYVRALPGAPDLAPFERAAALREALYGLGEEKNWRIPLRVSVVDMDPRIESLELTLGKDVLRYAHGPDMPLETVWESGGGKATASMAFRPRNSGLRPISELGPWALFRLLDRAAVVNRVSADELWLDFDFNGHSLTLSITATGVPLGPELFQGVQCPGQTGASSPNSSPNSSPTRPAARQAPSGLRETPIMEKTR